MFVTITVVSAVHNVIEPGRRIRLPPFGPGSIVGSLLCSEDLPGIHFGEWSFLGKSHDLIMISCINKYD